MIKPAQKEKIISRIKELEDINLIDEINRLLEIEFDDSPYITNQDQKDAIREARNQIKNGNTLTEDQADNEIDEWLEK
jgi:hypothetical protein